MDARPLRRHAAGPTLLELTIALAILGVLAVLAVPTLVTYWQAASLRAAAREIAGTIGLARQLAVSRKIPVCVDATAAGPRLRLGGCQGSFWTGPPTDAAGLISLSEAASIQIAANARVTFTPLGAAIPSGTYTVTHVRTRDSVAVVVAGSGRVSVQ
jgi:prepilin-type N-terminal cleavage/methylation domain-containing protein